MKTALSACSRLSLMSFIAFMKLLPVSAALLG